MASNGIVCSNVENGVRYSSGSCPGIEGDGLMGTSAPGGIGEDCERNT